MCVCFGLIKRFIYLFLLVDLSEYGTAETEQLNVFLLVYYSSEKFFVYKKRTMLLGFFFSVVSVGERVLFVKLFFNGLEHVWISVWIASKFFWISKPSLHDFWFLVFYFFKTNFSLELGFVDFFFLSKIHSSFE